MKVTAVNIGVPKIVSWRGKEIKTGIYKYPVENAIYLEEKDVAGDAVIDRKYHGGIEKACYVYSADHYAFWKELYPDLTWNYGMFGENITVEGLKEANLCIGDQYQLGTSKVQITQPREPCYKLGIRFETQKILKQFLAKTYCGSYVKIIEKGSVTKGDTMTLIKKGSSLSIEKLYQLFFNPKTSSEEIESALDNKFLTNNNREFLEKRLKILS